MWLTEDREAVLWIAGLNLLGLVAAYEFAAPEASPHTIVDAILFAVMAMSTSGVMEASVFPIWMKLYLIVALPLAILCWAYLIDSLLKPRNYFS